MVNTKFGKLDFEQSLSQLKKVVSEMERDNLTLASALALYEEGVSLARRCEQTLESAEQKVKAVLKDEDKELISSFQSEEEFVSDENSE